MKNKLPRPRFERAFVRWFRANRPRFAVPVSLKEVTANGIGLTFPAHPDCLFVGVSRGDLSVYVEWQGYNWDMLLSLDCLPERVPGGYRCRFALGASEVWLTREALWEHMLFAPFLSWVNDRLALASQLSLYGEPGCTTWAILSNGQDQSPKPESFLMSIRFPNVPCQLPADCGVNSAGLQSLFL